MDSMLWKLQGVLFTSNILLRGQLCIRGSLKRGQKSNYDITSALKELESSREAAILSKQEQVLQENCQHTFISASPPPVAS